MKKPKTVKPCDMPVMKAKCSTCPFGEHGNVSTRDWVMKHIFSTSSQICHHPQLRGKEGTHLCRGARDQQLILFHVMGLLESPTDEAWAAAWEKVKELE